MTLFRKYMLATITLAMTMPLFADYSLTHEIGIENHRIDYGYTAQLAYQLADLAEAMSYGARALVENGLNESIKNHRDVRHRAEVLHQAASNLYYLLRNYRGFGILDHRDGSVQNAFYSVSNAYQNLNSVAYGYGMQRITNVYYDLSYAINGY